MKRTLVLLALTGVASVALAQSPPPAPAWRHGSMAMRMQRMQRMEQWRLHQLTVLLDLSPAQQQQVKAIYDQQHAAMRASMQQVMQAMRAARLAHRDAHQQMMTRMAQVLNPAQMAKFRVLIPPHPRPFMRRKGPRGMGMGMGMGPPPTSKP